MLLLAAAANVCSRAAASSEGQWQGTSYPRVAASESSHPARFFVTDSGGSGGGFGGGDPHHHLGSIDFWNRNIGWACGNGGVFRSADGGLSWTRVKPRGGWAQVRLTGPQDVWLLESTFVDRKPVVHLWHSTDAGRNWQEPLPETLIGGFCLYARGRHCWIFSGRADGMSFASADGGQSWRRIDFHGLLAGGTHLAIPADVPTNAPAGPNEGFVAYAFGHRASGSRSPMAKSIDGGHEWEAITLPSDLPASELPKTMYFATSWKGWLGFKDGRILLTADGGRTWQWRNLPTHDQAVIALWMDQAGHGFASVANGPSWGSTNDAYVGAYRDAVFETHDDGQSWTPVLSGYKQINAFVALDANHVWGAGYSPTNVPNDLIVIWDR
ncbi:MAG TPA: hypothetical protein VMF30_02065 [Pirellulales bacterium]|nr:hypothetical protein [Pirellulales bacterium]